MGNRVIYIPTNDVEKPQQRCVLYFGNQRSVGFERIYEEYEWLVGDGSAYIEGINYNLWDNTISLQIGKTNVRGSRYFDANYLSITEAMSSSLSYLMVIFRQNSDSRPHIADIDPYSSMPDVVTMDFYIENSLFYCNQNGVVKTNNPAQTAIESTWKSVTPIIYSTKMSYIREVLPNNTYRSNLIPVKLLQPIPAILDGNGIAREAGECGMWDKVSNKFYGNVANSGTFTVKNPKCYEEYKWLNCYTADGAIPAQGADIGITPISLTDKVLTIELGQISRNVVIYGTSPYFIPMWCMYGNNMYVMLVQERKGNDIIHNMTYNWATSNTITLDFINNVATLGNSTFQIEGTGYAFRGFNSAMWQNPRTVGRIKISDELDLVPCKLTHGIPASMDANGIARPAGTCGMWDKVNDKFYGNVANSGSFTVSND